MYDQFTAADEQPVSSAYARIAFADNLLRAATRPERIAEVFATIIGDRIETGPITVGPGGLVSATAAGRTERAQVTPSQTDCCEMAVLVPVTFRIQARLGGIPAHYLAAACVRTRVTVVPAAPCALVVRHQSISRHNVTIKVRAKNALARLAEPFAHLNSLITDQVVSYVNRLVTSPRVRELSRIDVAQLIERAWDTGLVTGRMVGHQ
ncbi:hypothetical protein [Nocardia ignorata]|uniref:Uncharacterized protein n=1 Tax=Nocardia ignorata TaxID=145285 RepID=A0A4R6P312_NOCIG|nr:hypothetical protein [Nocardia ignorata]TDP31921.1 hypothetical protein DFR75_107146 [Nocardia ignorata]